MGPKPMKDRTAVARGMPKTTSSATPVPLLDRPVVDRMELMKLVQELTTPLKNVLKSTIWGWAGWEGRLVAAVVAAVTSVLFVMDVTVVDVCDEVVVTAVVDLLVVVVVVVDVVVACVAGAISATTWTGVLISGTMASTGFTVVL